MVWVYSTYPASARSAAERAVNMQPLVLEEVNIPEISSDQVLVRVAGAGMCRSDVQLIDSYFQEAIKSKFPIRLNSSKGTKTLTGL
jgi:D-arabinose 1-dehydrogenase-like Zn-dependent alcohol dehydrogenase